MTDEPAAEYLHTAPTAPSGWAAGEVPWLTRRKLPIGIQTFRKVREEGCYYVDKTAYLRRLVDEGTHYFLSRPRRFGKSLFLDTLKEAFEGSQALFEGLAVHDDWDWSVRHPVLRLSFGGGQFREPGRLHTNVMAQLDALERETGVKSGYDTAAERFGDLLRALHRHTGHRVVVLVDEYDKPILDALDLAEAARANRDFLRGFYGVIKDSDAHVRFTFLTGVSRFSKVSLFSGLNNLTDITLEPDYSAVCGYTDRDPLPARLPEPGGPPEPERKPAARHDPGRVAAGNPRDPALRAASGQRFRGAAEAVRGVLREHSPRLAPKEPHRPLRGLLRQRLLLALRGAGLGRRGGGQHQPRPPGHGSALQPEPVPVRVQGGRAGARGSGDGAVEGEGVRGQVPRPGAADSPDRGGVQPG